MASFEPKTVPGGRWIPSSERLPLPGRRVLIHLSPSPGRRGSACVEIAALRIYVWRGQGNPTHECSWEWPQHSIEAEHVHYWMDWVDLPPEDQ